MPKTILLDIKQIKKDYKEFSFEESDTFYWSAENKTIYYINSSLRTTEGFFRLFHEIGHGLLEHKKYASGVELLKMESAAWQKAVDEAKKYSVFIDLGHIEDCLDSYRDWLHVRSTCPNCHVVATEAAENTYTCFNCRQKWKVPKSQICRSYRLKLSHK